MNRKEETIHKYNLFYRILKSYERFVFKRFYRHFQVIDQKNIPFNEQYILTPNHQNALMDALAILNSCGTDVVFMARADIFHKKRQAKLLRFFKILPIYRIRDGAGELSKNEEIFDSAITILRDHIPVGMMPEGNHGDKRRLRPLVKGTMRIALRTQEKLGKERGVKIVPVGLDYEHYQKFFQDLLIIYGQPVEVSEFYESYLENPARAQNELRERLSAEMKKVIIHIENEELYDMYQNLREIYNKRMRSKVGILGKSHYERFRADKQMIRILDCKFESDPESLRLLSTKVNSYVEDLKELNIRNWIFERSGFTTKKLIYKRFGLLLTSPLYFYGYLNNYLPYRLPLRPLKNVKDPQFHSSFKFVLAMILFPVFYALQTTIVALLTGPAWIAWAYLLSLPATGYFALFWSIWYKRWRAGLKYRRMKKSRHEKILSLERKYKEIMETMDHIVNEYPGRFGEKDKKHEYV